MKMSKIMEERKWQLVAARYKFLGYFAAAESVKSPYSPIRRFWDVSSLLALLSVH